MAIELKHALLVALLLLLAAGVTAGPLDDLQPGQWWAAPGSHMADVFPNYSGPGRPENVIEAWSGAAYDSKRDLLLVWGGGHNDYYGNEIYRFNVAAVDNDPNTEEWEMKNPSAPPGRHTYDGLEYFENVDAMIAVDGSLASLNGGPVGDASYYYPGSNSWESLPGPPCVGLSLVSGKYFEDPITGDVSIKPGQDNRLIIRSRTCVAKFSTVEKKWTNLLSAGWNEPAVMGVVFPQQSQGRLVFLRIGDGSYAPLEAYEITASGVKKISLPMSGAADAVLSAQAPGIEWDPVAKKLVAYVGGSSVYLMDPETGNWTQQIGSAAPGSIVPGDPSKQGTYGRFRYIPSKNLYILVNDAHEDVYFYKLSDGTGIPPQPTPSLSFSANPASVSFNGSTTLTWGSSNVSSCTASGDWSGSKPLSGSETQGNLASNKTFTLSCSGSNGSVSRTATVTVGAPPAPAPTVSLNANPTGIQSGQSSALTWASTNASSCTASGGWAGSKTTSGTQTVSPASTTTYSLACSGSGGSASASTTVTVSAVPTPSTCLGDANLDNAVNILDVVLVVTHLIAKTYLAAADVVQDFVINILDVVGVATRIGSCPQAPPPFQPPTVSLTVNPQSLQVGQSALLLWSSENATTCTASGAWSGAKATSDSQSVSPSVSSTYSLACSGAGDSETKTVTVTVSSAPPPAPANEVLGQWVEGEDGTTRDYYLAGPSNVGILKWKNFMGDWHDAANTPQGDVAYAEAVATANAYAQLGVTQLVKEWVDGTHANKGMVLRGGTAFFASREHPDDAKRPKLFVTKADDSQVVLTAIADTHNHASTYRGAPLDAQTVNVSGSDSHGFVRFDLSSLQGAAIKQATLKLFVTQTFGSNPKLRVFRSSQTEADNAPLETGIAAAYPGDNGIANHPDVYFASGFESANWLDEWTTHFPYDVNHRTVTSDESIYGFSPLQGKALRVVIPAGGNNGMNLSWKFKEETGSEPEEACFRYYLRFATRFNPTDGGKLPGFSGTYDVAGWGGVPSHGDDGWSARGSFQMPLSQPPYQNRIPISNYVYHADMQDPSSPYFNFYGTTIIWTKGYRGLLELGKWYSVEQCIKLNTPGQHDGILRTWVDGRLASEKTDWMWRTVDKLKIEKLWAGIYHGGLGTPNEDLVFYLDNVVIAKKYIGPMAS